MEGNVPYGYNMLYKFKSKLDIILPKEIYQAVVANCGSLMKLFKVVKCVLKMVCKVPRHKGNQEIQLSAEAFATIIRSSQSWYHPDLKKNTD